MITCGPPRSDCHVQTVARGQGRRQFNSVNRASAFQTFYLVSQTTASFPLPDPFFSLCPSHSTETVQLLFTCR